jgi:hypothetical protein
MQILLLGAPYLASASPKVEPPLFGEAEPLLRFGFGGANASASSLWLRWSRCLCFFALASVEPMPPLLHIGSAEAEGRRKGEDVVLPRFAKEKQHLLHQNLVHKIYIALKVHFVLKVALYDYKQPYLY